MLRAHQQAWAWQDEWWGLSIEDVRAIEEETMRLLQEKYADGGLDGVTEGDDDEDEGSGSQTGGTTTAAVGPADTVAAEDGDEPHRQRMTSVTSEGNKSSVSVRVRPQQ